MRKYILSLIIIAMTTAYASAQQNRTQTLINAALKGWELELRVGYILGGTSPIPLPVEIRSIDSYNPTLGLSLEADVAKWMGEKDQWGLILGIKLENKNMKTKATVKNYGMEIFGDDGSRVAGRWTGGVRTSVKNSFLTFPVLGAYKINSRTNIKAGVFLSYLIDGSFTGYVYDGYLREGDPTGLKVVYADGKTAPYDFSDNLRHFQWGIQVGADWMAFRHLKIYADLSWGLNDAFKSNFNTITFDMYPIYANLGFGYLF